MAVKLMLVELTHYAVIAIDTQQLDHDSEESLHQDAEEQAKDYVLDILNDADGPNALQVLRQVNSVEDLLGTGLTTDALTYGDDAGGVRLGDLLRTQGKAVRQG